MTMLFSPGRVVATQGAIAALEREREDEMWQFANTTYLRRHLSGDWGEVPPEDARENKRSVDGGYRILSAYTLEKTGTKIWLITEADRSATTTLLPEEY